MKLTSVVVFCGMLFYGLQADSESAGKVRISGYAPGYAGEELVFYSRTDDISFTETEVVRFRVDKSDEFSVEIEADNAPLYIYTNVGVHYAYMYVEPGKSYKIVIPGKTEKSAREKNNPYFEGIPTHIAVINRDSTELNHLIRIFDQMYEPLFGEPLIRLTMNRDYELLDSISNAFEQRFAGYGNPYFQKYRKYKLGLLKIMARMQSASNVSSQYFYPEPVLYDNVAYMELFNQVYDRYFLFFSRTTKGKRIFEDINKHRSLDKLRNTLLTDNVLGEEQLLEMVILKGLHDAFYVEGFSRLGLLTVLDSLASTTTYPEHERIAGHIREKVTRLLEGFEPPDFRLMNREGDTMSVSDFRGYYVYLNFCTSVSYGCLSEYDVLSSLSEKYEKHLKVVTVFIDDSYESMLDFLNKNDYDWEFLFYGNQPSVLKDYDVRMFPTYYLMDRDGKLLMSPAPSPAEKFENYLFRTIHSRGEFR